MGDRIAVMKAGRIVQVDSPLAVYDNPADTYVGGFIGTPPMNFLEVTVDDGRVRLSGGEFPLPDDARVLDGRELLLGIRAEAITVEDEPRDASSRATVLVLEPLGSHNLLTVQSGDDLLKVATPPHVFRPMDSDVWLRLEPDRIRWMDRETGEAVRARDETEVAAAAPA
jgi:multiple sugar transport system ATP-binding protein